MRKDPSLPYDAYLASVLHVIYLYLDEDPPLYFPRRPTRRFIAYGQGSLSTGKQAPVGYRLPVTEYPVSESL